MKAVIIGSGIAGLMTANLLHRKNWEISIFDKRKILETMGLGFLIRSESIELINNMREEGAEKLPSTSIRQYNLFNEEEQQLKSVPLEDWNSIKREDIIKLLHRGLPLENITEGVSFSHFITESGKAIAAVFEDGTVEYGDLFIGADGSNSAVRSQILKPVPFLDNEVMEVVCVVRNEGLQISKDVFTKFKMKDIGLSFGYVPLTEGEFIWFMQYDQHYFKREFSKTKGDFKGFCAKIAEHFPQKVRNIIDQSDFSNAYLWKTKDFNLLPYFGKHNIVLVGDAAHLTLPFTSSGVNFAITDALLLVDLLEKHNDFKLLNKDYYEQRAEEVAKTIELGRILKNQFLNNDYQKNEDLILPLMSK